MGWSRDGGNLVLGRVFARSSKGGWNAARLPGGAPAPAVPLISEEPAYISGSTRWRGEGIWLVRAGEPGNAGGGSMASRH